MGGEVGEGGETEGRNETRQSVQGRDARHVATFPASFSLTYEIAPSAAKQRRSRHAPACPQACQATHLRCAEMRKNACQGCGMLQI